MLKMIIQMNNEKINQEKTYSLNSITQTIDNLFAKMELIKLEDTSDALIYCDTGNARDYGRFGRIVNTLKKQIWFMDNVSAWFLYDSDDSENPEDFNEEDLLKHYRKKQAMGA